MVGSHERAEEFAQDVLEFVGVMGAVVTGRVKVVSKRAHPGCADCQRLAARWNHPSPHGCATMIFPEVRERTEAIDGDEDTSGSHTASVHYTLPFEPEPMKRRIIKQLAPSAARYL